MEPVTKEASAPPQPPSAPGVAQSGIVEVAPGVAYIKAGMANVYFVGEPGGNWVLIDTGVPGKAPKIIDAALRRYGPGARPEAILLTHGHADHSGSAKELAEYWNVPVYVHRLEMPYLTGRSPYPPADPTTPGYMAFTTRFIKRQIPDLSDHVRAFDMGDRLPGLEHWECHLTCGHTAGHVVFFRPYDAVLIAGDAIVTVDLDSAMAVALKRQRVCRPPAPFTPDWRQARESVRFMAGLRPFVIATGHGRPMSGNEATAQLASLARDFPIPRRGRYVVEPARLNDNGVVSLPPEPEDTLPKKAAIAGVAALVCAGLGFLLTRRNRE